MRTFSQRIAFLFILLIFFVSSAFAGPRILLIHGSVGMGHTAAAEGVKRDLLKRYPDAEIVVKDLLDFQSNFEKKTMSIGYDVLTQKFPWLYDESFRDYCGIGREVKSIGDMPLTAKFHPDEVLKYINGVKPDIILTTFPSGAEVLIHLRDEGFLRDIPTGWVHTDLVDETYFARIPMELDMAFVGNQEIRDSWIRRGVPASRVEATGMPLNPKVLEVSDDADIAKIRLARGFSEDYKTVLLLGGSNGVGDYQLMVNKIFEQFPGQKLQIIAVCGRSKKNFANLQKLQASLPPEHRLSITGLVPQDELFDYMRVSDAIVSKTGGLTPMELFYRKKPLVLLDINGGQEKYNADVFREVGLARVIQDQRQVGTEIRLVMENQPMAAKLVDQELDFIKNQHPEAIADWIMSKPKALKRLDGLKLDTSPDYPRPEGLIWKCTRFFRHLGQ